MLNIFLTRLPPLVVPDGYWTCIISVRVLKARFFSGKKYFLNKYIVKMQMFGQFPKRDLRLCNCTFAKYQILTSQYGAFFISLTTHPSNSTCLRHWVITIKGYFGIRIIFLWPTIKIKIKFPEALAVWYIHYIQEW